MTIIAYRDGVLASDTLVTDPDSLSKCYYAKKTVKAPDGALAGAAGNCDYCCDFLEWAVTDRTKPAPKSKDSKDSGMLITPEGKIRIYFGRVYDEMYDTCNAIGSGSSYAMGAFHMGATAKQAAEAAIRFSMGCGGKIQLLTLDGKVKKCNTQKKKLKT